MKQMIDSGKILATGSLKSVRQSQFSTSYIGAILKNVLPLQRKAILLNFWRFSRQNQVKTVKYTRKIAASFGMLKMTLYVFASNLHMRFPILKNQKLSVNKLWEFWLLKISFLNSDNELAIC